MKVADKIRGMTDQQLLSLLVWGYEMTIGDVPDCDEGCEDYGSGCANNCPHDKRERAVREWLGMEVRG